MGGGQIGGNGGGLNGAVNLRSTPQTRHASMIDGIDNGNLVADINLSRISSMLNSRHHSGVRQTQMLMNLGSFVTQVQNNPRFNEHIGRASQIADTILSNLSNEIIDLTRDNNDSDNNNN